MASSQEGCGVVQAAARVGVVGIGNLLLADEGLGVHAVRALLSAGGLGEATPVIDGGTDPWSALEAARGCAALVLVDAVRGSGAPGEVYRLGLDEVETTDVMLSLHGVSLLHLLQYERVLGNGFEEVTLIGMEPFSIEPGLELSDCCRQRLPALVEMIGCEVGRVRDRLAARRGGPHAGH